MKLLTRQTSWKIIIAVFIWQYVGRLVITIGKYFPTVWHLFFSHRELRLQCTKALGCIPLLVWSICSQRCSKTMDTRQAKLLPLRLGLEIATFNLKTFSRVKSKKKVQNGQFSCHVQFESQFKLPQWHVLEELWVYYRSVQTGLDSL